MASIIREELLDVEAEVAWAAVRDVGAVHEKLVPDIVNAVTLDRGVRHVVFANGLEVDEAIVTIDDAAKRLVYAVQNRTKHHQASMQVFAAGKERCRFVWITDILPDDSASRFSSVMDQALPVIKRTVERQAQHP